MLKFISDIVTMFMSEYTPCWKVDLMSDLEAIAYYGDCQNHLLKKSKDKVSTFSTIEYWKMALKPRLANSPTVDSNTGLCTATIADITFLEDGESEYTGEQFLFDFVAQGIQRQINLKVWTGTKINPEKYQINGGKSKDYNKLTRLCLALGLVSELDLKAIKTEADLDQLGIGEKLEGLKGQDVRFKLQKNAKSKGLSQIDLNTLELVKPITSKE